jgi:hypothetical protein
MANTNVKVTQAQVLNAIIAACDDGAEFGSYGVSTAEVKAYCVKKIVQVQNKKASVNPQKVAEKEEFFEGIREIIGAQTLTASEIMKAYNAQFGTDYSLPKITNALTAMGEKGTGDVVRTVDKKTAYFSLA